MPSISGRWVVGFSMGMWISVMGWAGPPDLPAAVPVAGMDPAGYPAPNVECLATDKCHSGIEPIRSHDSQMAKQIYAKGSELGDPNGCVVCHGGNPKEEKEAKMAHSGAPQGGAVTTFVVHAGSVWVNEKTCGQCHQEWTYSQHRSIMQTEAGKIQGALWGWGRLPRAMPKNTGITMLPTPTARNPSSAPQPIKPIPRP